MTITSSTLEAVSPPAGGNTRDAVGLYTPEQRARRDASRWTLVQGILAPLQFLVMIGSAVLIVYSLQTGALVGWADASVVLKTVLLLTIMVTGSLWEHDVYGKYLFAPAFFWEDVVSMGVIVLHLAYMAALLGDLLPTDQRFLLALVAYAAYGVNAIQFVLKLRRARLDARRAESSETSSDISAATSDGAPA